MISTKELNYFGQATPNTGASAVAQPFGRIFLKDALYEGQISARSAAGYGRLTLLGADGGVAQVWGKWSEGGLERYSRATWPQAGGSAAGSYEGGPLACDDASPAVAGLYLARFCDKNSTRAVVYSALRWKIIDLFKTAPKGVLTLDDFKKVLGIKYDFLIDKDLILNN